jgi:hypothetical protein
MGLSATIADRYEGLKHAAARDDHGNDVDTE